MSEFVALAVIAVCLLVLLALYVASVTVFPDTIPPKDDEENGHAH